MRKVVKGKLGELTFQLNPSNMSYDSGAVWAQTNSPGMENPISSYSYGKAKVFSFELWFNTRHLAPVDMAEVYRKLNEYRDGKEPVLFAYGSFVKKVVITECPFNIEAWNRNLSIIEMKVPVTLRVV